VTAAARLEPADGADASSLLARYREELRQILGLDEVPNSPASPAELSPPAGGFVVVRDERGAALGCGGFRRLEPGVCEVKHMFVVPEARGRGVGRLLLAEIERAARAAGYAEARLDTAAPLTAAIALYRSSGWLPIPPYNDNPLSAHWLRKRLAP
jgi:GNAT superfamily N-acetyltransferase